MNVNPFSYLIEKLKGKVNKSGDTINGQLTVDAANGSAGVNAYTYLRVGNQILKSSAKHSTGLLRLCGENGYYTSVYAPNSTASREILLPNASGTVALTSDYGAKTVVETRHDIVFNNSDTSNWIDPPSAISSKTIYAMVFSSLDGGGGLVTREAGGSNRFAIRWSATITATLNARLVWFYTD